MFAYVYTYNLKLTNTNTTIILLHYCYIKFDKPQILANENRYIPRMIREAIEIQKHPNFNA